MKYLHIQAFCLMMLLSCATAFSQKAVPLNEPNHNKPRLFTNLPDRIPVAISEIQNLLNAPMNKEISLRLGQDANGIFKGNVVSRADDNIIHSVVIRSANFNGATLSLSSSTQPDGTVKITGRIISLQHGDLYELQNQNNQYILIKKDYYDLINE